MSEWKGLVMMDNLIDYSFAYIITWIYFLTDYCSLST